MAASGQVTVTTAGTAVRMTSEPGAPGFDFIIKALPANTGVMYIGNDGADDVSSSTGFPLSAGDIMVVKATNLDQLFVDASVNSESVAWIKIEV